ncbi:hypothetical protein LOAG_02101 [Loa loa]|uniref:Uncharacterized protein n=1 Tax=Loa loa TaxID=7209 RepID=A0A1S0U7P0_LOALO|nr:hypothetical protein LOAG_02101 [Loa loa]EFO26381.2 hypothetical protein LOAG_02101 [Loa loa]
MAHRFGIQNPLLLVVYTYQQENEKRWTGDFFIEIDKNNIILYDAGYGMQAATWKPFSNADASHILFLQKGPHDIINYKLHCLCPRKYTPYVEISSNSGTLARNFRKKIRIRTDSSTIRDAEFKMFIGNFNHFLNIVKV